MSEDAQNGEAPREHLQEPTLLSRYAALELIEGMNQKPSRFNIDLADFIIWGGWIVALLSWIALIVALIFD